MDPAQKLGKRVSHKLRAVLNKLGFGDKTLKIILLAGLFIFGASLLLFKFELLSYLSSDETIRLNSVTHLKLFAENPTDPVQGVLQWLTLKLLPNHHIFAMRLPAALLLGATLSLAAIILYLKFRNRYLPYIFAIFSITSPWIILLSHQGYIPGIDLPTLGMTILAAYFIITKSDIPDRFKSLALFSAAIATGLLTLQPFGVLYLVLIIILCRKSKMMREYISSKNKSIKIALISILILIPLINIAFLYINIDNWKLLTGLNLVMHPADNLKALLYNTRSIFDISQDTGLSLGTGRPDFLLIGALALTIYEIFKRRVGRKGLVIGLTLSLVVSALYKTPTSIVLVVPFTIAILSLALANMIRIIDAAFPRNPYPRNIARTGMLILVCVLTSLNIYTFISATARENTPNQINIITSKRDK